MIRIGHYNKLAIVRFTEYGAILDGEGKDILMPKKYTTAAMKAGDEVEVFVYYDQSDRIVATTEKPLAEVGQFAFLTTSWTNRYGAFMDWGLLKDLFVPFREQRKPFVTGRKYLVYIYIDEKTGRIVGTSKLDRCLSTNFPPFHPGQEIKILIWKNTNLGYKVITEGNYGGLIFANEIFQPINIGDRLTAIVEQVREDGKIDLVLQGWGRQLIEDFSERLMQKLDEAGGTLPFSDNSSPEEITHFFNVSKKTFKKTLGMLYKKHLITITDSEIKKN